MLLGVIGVIETRWTCYHIDAWLVDILQAILSYLIHLNLILIKIALYP